MGLFGRKGKGDKEAAPPAARKRRVLIVDDDLTIAELNQTIFVGRQWEVQTAYSATGALSTVNAWKPDLILLDLMLPDLPGERVLDSIRSLRLNTKVIVVTGRYVTQKDFDPWLNLVVSVLRKPYPMSDLANLVGQFERGQELKPKLGTVGDV